MFSIEKVESFPEITRSGRTSQELQMIIDSLKTSAENGERYCISNVTAGNAYNSMQQRIRAQAKKLNLKIMIRFDAESEKLYFKADPMKESVPAIELNTNVDSKPSSKASVKSSQVKGIKTQSLDSEEAF
jgi:hypothetical protein